MAREEPRWHPLMAAVEGPPLTWRLLDTYDREYGRITAVRVDGEPTYRLEFRGEHRGYAPTLREAVETVHQLFIRAHAPGGFAPSPWPSTQKSAPGTRP
ncbi:hypothetical protein ACFWWU_36575 [Streptomyces sp. NPDC058650]|uniref:hypothetical protein n=1 Tax=Streptomyces sp. NPDC058650 TaxID=3346575 RepID=UPI00366235CC